MLLGTVIVGGAVMVIAIVLVMDILIVWVIVIVVVVVDGLAVLCDRRVAVSTRASNASLTIITNTTTLNKTAFHAYGSCVYRASNAFGKSIYTAFNPNMCANTIIQKGRLSRRRVEDRIFSFLHHSVDPRVIVV